MLVKVPTERERAIERIEAKLQKSAADATALRRSYPQLFPLIDAAVAGRKPEPLTAKTILQIADTVKVPDTELDFFAARVHSLVGRACGAAQLHKAWQASDLKSSAKRIEKAARELEVAIGEATEGAREHLRLRLPADRRPRSLSEHGRMASELADAAKVASRLERREPWVELRKLLISEFASNVAKAGGRLTASGEEGTLFDAFDRLGSCLPEKFRASRSTLRRIWRKETRGSKQVRI